MVELAAPVPAGTVADIMTREVDTARPWRDVADLVAAMADRGIRAVPVVDAAGRLVGIVTRRDIVRTYTRTDEEIEADVRRRLAWLDGEGRWEVSVDRGSVHLVDPVGDPARRVPAAVVAAAVPGVLTVRDISRRIDHGRHPRHPTRTAPRERRRSAGGAPQFTPPRPAAATAKEGAVRASVDTALQGERSRQLTGMRPSGEDTSVPRERETQRARGGKRR